MTHQQLSKISRIEFSLGNSIRSFFFALLVFLTFYIPKSSAQIKLEIAGSKHFTAVSYQDWLNLSFYKSAAEIHEDTIKVKIYSSLSAEGFYNAEVLKVERDSLLLRIVVNEGEPTIIRNITIKEKLSDSLFVKNTLEQIKGEIFSADVVESTFKNILTQYENTGYPFAVLKADAVSFTFDSINGKHFADLIFSVDEGTKARIDRIIVEGNSKTKDYVVTRSARIGIGDLYIQKVIEDIPNRLNRLRFFEQLEQPSFYITTSNIGVLKISVKEKETNSFDGIAGYVPGTGENESGYLTGFININLRNLFGTGRGALIKWMQENKSSQELQLKYFEPWLFGYPFNFETSLFQRKQDSSYVQRNAELSLEYLASEDLSASFLLNSQSTIPAEKTGNSSTVFNSTSLTTGFFIKIDSRDDFYSPTKGLFFNTGYKFTKKNISSTNTPDVNLLQTNYSHQRIELDFSFYQRIFERQILHLALHGRELKGTNLDLSDLYFLGGTNTLRGYREKQFQGNRLLWSNLEYRFLITQRTYAFAFFDYGYIFKNEAVYQNNSRTINNKSGFGFGLNIETGLGVLGVSFALGNGDSFSDGKIHFGIINEF